MFLQKYCHRNYFSLELFFTGTIFHWNYFSLELRAPNPEATLILEPGMNIEQFERLIAVVTSHLAESTLDQTTAEQLNKQFPVQSEDFLAIERACQQGVSEGWMCQHEAGGIHYGRVIKAGKKTHNFSVDVVKMKDVKGPHHSHPLGEINMIMPITPGARFDGHSAGWWVYPPGSAHHPTVTEGEALVLYLLPQGSIEFTR